MAIPSDKDIIFKKVKGYFQKSNSLTQFEKLLQKNNLKTYSRGGKLTGVYYGKRKYRFKHSLGIDLQLLLLKKDKTQERFASLQRQRNQQDLDRSNDIER